jgi:DNA-binding CsgD family transcriptional regulator/tetratricopeptide (TPR) repeat protein
MTLDAADSAVDADEHALPPAIRQSLLRRLDTLSDRTTGVLRAAAVLGGTGRVEHVAALTGAEVREVVAAVDEAVRAGLLDERGDRLVFRHALIRASLYEDVPEAARGMMHAAAARVLEPSADPAVVARHLVLGAMPGDADALAALRRTGAALIAERPDAAAQTLHRALELETDAGRRADIAADLVEALLGAGRAVDAARVVTEAPLDAASDATRARVELGRAEAAISRGRNAEAAEALHAALATDALPADEAATVRAQLALARLWLGQQDAALVEASLAIEEGERLENRAAIATALATRSLLYGLRGEIDIAIAEGRRAVEVARNDVEAMRRTPHLYFAVALYLAERNEEARAVAGEGRELALERGQLSSVTGFSSLLASLAWFDGRYDDAVVEIDAAVLLAQDLGLRMGGGTPDALGALIAFHRGDHDTARRVLAELAAAEGDYDFGLGLGTVLLLRSRLHAVDGDEAAALSVLLDGLDGARLIGFETPRPWLGPDAVRCALAVGDIASARRVADDMTEIANRVGTPAARGAAEWSCGMIDQDVDALARAATWYASANRPLAEALIHETAGMVLVDAGRADDAVSELDRALTILSDLGAWHDAGRVTAALRALGGGDASGERTDLPKAGWDSLTPTELQVCELVAEGLSNPEISDRLLASRRTVESHLHHIFTKLDLRTRLELTDEVLRRREPLPA